MRVMDRLGAVLQLITWRRIRWTIIFGVMGWMIIQRILFLSHDYRFEDYDNPADARAALLKLHPIGTPIAALRKNFQTACREMVTSLVNPSESATARHDRSEKASA